MNTQNSLRPASRDSNQPTAAPDTGDLVTDSLADAGYWKGEARKAQAVKADLLAALEAVTNYLGALNEGKGSPHSSLLDEARAAIARAKQP